RNSVTIATFGHAGDGNLHPTIVYPHDDPEAEARAQIAFSQVLDIALAVGGTVTGEHGVGLLKARALGRELDPVAISVHSAIKAALDPAGILNPGKALPIG
ncbi:MAG: FAD-linked oxidase C-terminal domain-containing protein, partial [Actinomycetes bacterium]